MGAWLRVNGEAIYATRAMTPHASGRVRFTSGKDDVVYAIYLAEDEGAGLPRTLSLNGVRPAAGARVTLLGSNAKVTWEATPEGAIPRLPGGLRALAAHAWAFRITRAAQNR